MEETRKRYSDEELEEFRTLINAKLEKAEEEYERLRANIISNEPNSGDENVRKNDPLDESSDTMQLALDRQLADRQYQLIQKLRQALVRIDNKTYGVCRVTGELIPKERLRAVPHATLSMEAKQK